MRWISRAIAGLVLSAALVHGGALNAQGEPPGALSLRPANLDMRGESLLDALRLLQARSGVPIGFSPDLLPDTRVDRCECVDMTVAEALDILLAGTRLTWQERRGQILIAPRDARAPATGGVVGTVVDNESGTPIRAARVEIREHRMAALTNAEGRFLFPAVPPGTYNVDVDALGFRAVGSSQAVVTAGAYARLELGLERSPLALAEIIVSPGTFGAIEEAALFPQTLTRTEMDALPQLGEDVFRTLERLPGVASDDISAKLRVRGGRDDELLIMLDGAELFEPYHMKDLDSVLGIVDMGTLRGVSLVAGGMPTEFGDHMTGLLSMQTQQPIGGGTHHAIGFSVSNITARSQGSFASGRGGWLVSARRGFLDILLSLASQTNSGETNDDLSPKYFDVLAKVEFLAGVSHRLSAHILYAGDDLDLVDIDSPIARASLSTDWTNLNLWAGWDWTASPTLDVSTVLSTSTLTRGRTGDVMDPGASEAPDFANVTDRADFTAATIRQDWRLAVGRRTVLKFGGQSRWTSSEYSYRSVIGRELADPSGTVGVAFDTTDVSLDPNATEYSAYLAARVQPLDRVTLEVGARYDHRSHTSDSDVSPRAQAAVDLGPATTLRGSWGTYRQSHGVEELSVVDADTTFFPSELARQFAVGLQHRFDGGLQARIEAYDRRISNPRPRYLNVGREIIPFPEIGNDRVRFDPDKGRARGVEAILSGPSGARSEWTATYVLAKAEDRVGNEWIARALDQRHTVSLRWSFTPNAKWQLSASWQFHTGWPSTPMEFQVDTVTGTGPDAGRILVEESPGAINSRRLPAYHRMDMRATRSFNVRRGRLRVFLDVFNLYNRENLRSYDYAVQLPQGRVRASAGETLLPLLPSFGITWEF